MKLGIGLAALFITTAQFALGQTSENSRLTAANGAEAKASANDYAVIGSTAEQEAFLRSQIQLMQPAVLPLRVVFLPHWKYLDTAKTFQLHIPAGYGSLMFTHLPSKTVFIDNDRYQGPQWLGHWIAHELGHLATNSPREDDAERAAREFRKRLRDLQNQDLH